MLTSRILRIAIIILSPMFIIVFSFAVLPPQSRTIPVGTTLADFILPGSQPL